jgi:alkylation response protein AidB-like acyl-CoA dehydrogenase
VSAKLALAHRTAAGSRVSSIEVLIAENDRLSREILAVRADEVDRNRRFPRENLDALGQSGLLGLLVPTEYGGPGGGMQEMSQVLDRMGQSCPSTAMVTLMHYCGTAVLVASASPKLKDAVLPTIAGGEHLTTLAFSEPGSGGHFYCPISQLTRDGKGMLLSAKKSFVTSAGEADSYVVSTRSVSAKRPTDVDLFFVPKEAQGLEVCGRFDGLGMGGNASAPMKLEVMVNEEARIGEESSGFQTMLQVVLPHFQIGSASVFLGMAEAAFQGATAHLTSRKYEHLGGTSMAEIPRAQFIAGEMALEIRSTRAYLGETIRRAISGNSQAVLDILGIKARAADACLAVVSRAMTVCGGTAYGRRGGLERIFRDAQAAPVMAPSSDVLKEFLGKASLGLPLF